MRVLHFEIVADAAEELGGACSPQLLQETLAREGELLTLDQVSAACERAVSAGLMLRDTGNIAMGVVQVLYASSGRLFPQAESPFDRPRPPSSVWELGDRARGKVKPEWPTANTERNQREPKQRRAVERPARDEREPKQRRAARRDGPLERLSKRSDRPAARRQRA